MAQSEQEQYLRSLADFLQRDLKSGVQIRRNGALRRIRRALAITNAMQDAEVVLNFRRTDALDVIAVEQGYRDWRDLGNSQGLVDPGERLKTFRMADISTGHVTESDSDLLERFAEDDNRLPVVAMYEEGFVLHVTYDTVDEQEEELREAGASDSLIGILRRAREEGFHYIILDRDAEQYSSLPKHDW